MSYETTLSFAPVVWLEMISYMYLKIGWANILRFILGLADVTVLKAAEATMVNEPHAPLRNAVAKLQTCS